MHEILLPVKQKQCFFFFFFPDAPQGSNPKTFYHWNHFCTGRIPRLHATCQSAPDLEDSRASKAASWHLHCTAKCCPSDTLRVYMHDILAEVTAVCIFPLCLCGVFVYLFTATISLEGDFLQEPSHRILMSLLFNYQEGNYELGIKLTCFRGQAFTLSFPVSLPLIFYVVWSPNCKNLFTLKPFKRP